MVIYNLRVLNLKSVLVEGEHVGPHAAVMGILFQHKLQIVFQIVFFKLPCPYQFMQCTSLVGLQPRSTFKIEITKCKL